MLAVPKTFEDDGVPEDVHVPAMGLDGELIFGCESYKSTPPMYFL